MTVVVTDGSPTVFTEEVYDGAEASRKWLQVIEAALENASLARVYVPEGQGELAALAADSDKVVLFDVAGFEMPSGAQPVRRSGRWRWMLAAGVGLGITGGALAFAWRFFRVRTNRVRRSTGSKPRASMFSRCWSTVFRSWRNAGPWRRSGTWSRKDACLTRTSVLRDYRSFPVMALTPTVCTAWHATGMSI